MALGANLRWLDLAGTAVTDAGLSQLSATPNLTRLHLERTGITDAGLKHVSKLQQLEYLNLYATTVTDEGLEEIKELLPCARCNCGRARSVQQGRRVSPMAGSTKTS